MAGIGIELNKLLVKRDYHSVARAYAYAGLITCGPWLITVLTLGILGTGLKSLDPSQHFSAFPASVAVIYSFTLILTGPLQMVLARYIADQQFIQQTDRIFPAFAFLFAWVAAFFTLFGLALFLGFVPGPLLFRLSAALLTTAVATIWLSSILLTGLKSYRTVFWCFASGCATSLGAAYVGAALYGLSGAMFGYMLGHVLLAFLLCFAIFREVGNLEISAGELPTTFQKYWELAAVGLLYNLGIWIDKFLYWWLDPRAERVSGILFTSPIFDRVVFFSLLTIIPGMAVFLLKLETDFGVKCRAFYHAVLNKATLDEILAAKRALVQSLTDGFTTLVKVQGLLTAMLVLGSERVLSTLRLSAVQVGVFQVALVACFLLVLFIALLTVLYYLDKRRGALLCSLVFALTNAGVTALTIRAAERGYGLGFLVAAALGMILAAGLVNFHLRRLDYETFALQPVLD